MADEAGLQYREGWVRKAAVYFDEQGYINEAFTLGGGSDGNLSAEIKAEGLEFVEVLLELRWSHIVGQFGSQVKVYSGV